MRRLMAGMGVGCNSGGGQQGAFWEIRAFGFNKKKRGQSPKNCSVTSGMLTC